MKLIVFGATGGVGKLFVQQAIEKGHEVTAFVRSPEKMDVTGVHIVQGDAFDTASVSNAIEGHDVVVSCVGSTEGPEKHTSIEKMVRNIADGMEKHNVTRVLYCASAGVDHELPGLMGKMVMKMLEKPLKDHRNALNYLLSKNVTYTIARPMGLKNDSIELDYTEVFDGPPEGKSSIPRASVAHFLVKALDDSKYENASVGLASAK